jgi:hypothetical protein
MITIDERAEALKQRAAEIIRRQDGPAAPAEPDEQELKERQEAAQAYGEENEAHFVDYLMDCVKQSVRAYEDIRDVQAACYNAFQENEPLNYAKKEAWQARIVVPKPFTTVSYGAAAVQKAFTPKFLTVSDAHVQAHGDFWQKVMEYALGPMAAKFPTRYTDAVTMSLAAGISQEMIPRFVPGQGLEYCLVEPWKIHRDPDAMSRENQSGIYWIHQEWVDFYVLKELEKKGRYKKVDRCVETTESAADPFLTKERIAARKQMVWSRSPYRKLVETFEFWGTVLDSKANLLLPKGSYTVAGGRVIALPKVPETKLRWPGIAFSPMPDLLRFGGRGLLQGVLSVWQAMNDLMCLHQDYLLWIVNPMREINVENLVDPEDTKTWPGKEFLVRDSPNGQQNVRTVDQRFITNEILSNLQYHDQNYQRGSFVPDIIQGLPGWRKEVTFREQQQNLDQALGVYSLMGTNLEDGAIDAVHAGAETIYRLADFAFYRKIFTPEELRAYGVRQDPTAANGVAGVPPVDGSFRISGIQSLMKEAEALMNIQKIFLPLMGNPRFAARIKPYKLLQSIETRTNMRDEGLLVSEEEDKAITAAEMAGAKEKAEAIARQMELAEASAAADLVNKVGQQPAPGPGGEHG